TRRSIQLSRKFRDHLQPTRGKIIIGADLNGHNTLWGYRSNDNRGKASWTFILANNLNIIIKPDALPTFQRNSSVGWL
ncbi:hypothetical protein AVEN_161956-1, partial [Araneus ventricosus]